MTRRIPDEVKVFSIDPERALVELQSDDDGLCLVIIEGQLWIEVPLISRDDFAAAWSLANRLSAALSIAGRGR